MPAAGNGGVAARLGALGLSLPLPPTPLGQYVPASRSGSLLFLSGMLPLENGSLVRRGRIGDQVSVASATSAARVAALNALAVAAAEAGGLDRIRRPVRLGLVMMTTADFGAHATVADGVSALFAQLFDAGHARYVAGVYSLPLQAPLVLDVVFEVEG